MSPLTSEPVLEADNGKRIGLLGGSFNPAHEGHLHISTYALELLALDEIWWLVSPQNPLKSADGMATLDERVSDAIELAEGRVITVTDIEEDLGTRFTADTLSALNVRFPEARFVWLMGADNLLQIDQWKRWESIFESVPIAVFARPPYSENVENAKASRYFDEFRLDSTQAQNLAEQSPPAWVYLRTPENPVSATKIRTAATGPV